MAGDTRARLLEGALETLRTKGIAGASARSIAAAAGVNQALVFYHFGSVDELLAAAVRHGAQQRVATYRERLSSVTSLRELLDLGRSLHADERAAGNLAVLAQRLAGAQTDARLGAATAAGLGLWVAEIETVLGRILGSGPVAEFVDLGGLARAVAAAFVGLELYEGVDTVGADLAMGALEQLATLTTMLEDVGPAVGKTINRRARKVPGSLWSSWAVRLGPPDRAYHRTLAPVLSSAVLLAGSRMDLGEAATRLGSVTDDRTISRILRLLADDPCWEAIATAVTRLADYLDNHDVPVDYHRRRRLDYSGLLPPRQWLDLCRRTGVLPGQGRKDKIVRCMLFARISGLPVEAAPDFSATSEAYFRTETARFAAIRTPELAAVLDQAARDFLTKQRVGGEPVIWHPPVSLLSDLDLPGPDTSLIDVTPLHELVQGRRYPAQHAAGVLCTTVDAVRLVLDQHPAPARAIGGPTHAH